VGINLDNVGQLSVDSDKLRGYLTTNFNDIQKLFVATGTGSTGTLEYIAHDVKTKEGEFTVHIDTAATQSTSVPSDNTSLTGPEALTITEGGSTAVVNLTSSMSMTQIANAVNSELEAVYTQVLTGAEQLYADALHTTAITTSTKWNSVYNSSGAPAGLIAGDVISFSGNTRNGASVEGSYSIINTGTDSVQGLLSAVETAFDNQVTAAINADGRIVVTDKTSGTSSVALTFDYSQAHSLDFGSVLTTNAGGQKGRYAMDITASADSGSHLVLAHNNYGTGNNFTIHQQNNLLWTGGDQTVNNGVNVAGTINGEAATGDGQMLKGNSGDANADGLSIKYTGSASGLDAGTVKVTFGVAELFDRVLFNITDSQEGYVSYKQQSVQDSISSYTTQIEEMEARLLLKKNVLLNRFAQMETALQKIQNQSNWLGGQTEAASNGWYKAK